MNKIRHKIFFVLALVFSIAGISFANEYSDGNVIVVLKPRAEEGVTLSSVSLAETFAEVAEAEVVETYDEISNLGNGVFTLLHSNYMDAEEFAEELKNNPDVLAALPNYKVELAALPNDSSFSQTNCWGMFSIDVPAAWDKSTGSNSVYVAMIDTGVDYTNPDISPNYNSTYSSQFSSQQDTQGHGTHVAGIIGAKGNNSIGLAGVNWDVGLIAVNALPGGNGDLASVIKGLNFVTGLIKSGVNIKAVNLSIQTYYNSEPTYANLIKDPFWQACKALDSLNQAVIVVAAGNYSDTLGEYSSARGGYCYPASFKGLNNMISVGALDKNGTLASFSNKGADVAAPGVDILSTYLQSSSSEAVSTKTMKGTSMATPFVTGAAALLASINSDLTAYQIKTILVNGNSKSVSTAGEVEISSSEKIFNISEGITYYNNNKDTILSSTPETSQYDNYSDQSSSSSNNSSSNNNSNSSSGSGSGGGGCNSLMIGMFAAGIFIPLAKKFKR